MCKKNKKTDRCGPKVVNWKTWILSMIIPDDLWGIDISEACGRHDDAYSTGGDQTMKDNADEDFRDEIKALLTEGGISYLKATGAADLYYLGVHIGGKEHFKWTY